MIKGLNKHCIALLGATFFAAGAAYGVVDQTKAQIISPEKSYPGSILGIRNIQSRRTGLPGMRMTLKVGQNKTLKVYMSSEWIGLSKRMGLTEGDRIVVSGPMIKTGNTASLLAKSIKKGSTKIMLTPKYSE